MPPSLKPQAPSLILSAPAKVNLRLEVLSRRPDGYHELQMINASLDLHDTLQIEKTRSGISLACDEPSLTAGEDNLAYRAAKAIMDRAGTGQGVAVRLEKRIPIGAGLGGGSSDAAAVLLGMNRLFALGLSLLELSEIGLALGADVPYFLHGGPAVVRGIGERISPFGLAKEFQLVLVNPGFPVSTKSVYQAASSALTLPQKATTLPTSFGGEEGLAGLMRNDLERVVSARHPEISEMKSALAAGGAAAAMMSGSGPTVFGIFPGAVLPDLEKIRAGRPWRIIPARTLIGA